MIRSFLCALFIFTGILSCRDSSGAAGQNLHLVVDAGSSGTRFCLFEVRAGAGGDASGCRAVPAAEPFERCRKVKARDGLADLDPAEITATLTRGLSGFPATIREDLDGVIVLGTGGFRRKGSRERDAALKRIGGYFESAGLPAHVEVITGETEGRLAWQTVRQIRGSSDHAILETGGATIQFAAAGPADLRAISLPLGMNETFRRLKKLPEFKSCYVVPGADRATIDFAACSALIGARIFAGSGLEAFAAKTARTGKGGANPGPRLFGLGSPWQALFDMSKKTTLTPAELRRHANEYCKKSVDELKAAGVPAKHAPRTCYLWSYQTALFEATGMGRIESGGESWPRGAAASGDYFKVCRVAGE